MNNVFRHRTVAEIQRKTIKQSGRSRISRLVNARGDKEQIIAWKLELDRILQVFNVRLITSGWSLLIVVRSD